MGTSDFRDVTSESTPQWVYLTLLYLQQKPDGKINLWHELSGNVAKTFYKRVITETKNKQTVTTHVIHIDVSMLHLTNTVLA